MLSLLGLKRCSWFLIFLMVLVQDCNAAAATLGIRQSGKGGGGDGDSDSDSDDDTEQCRNGVCVFCRKGVCTTSTQGSNQASQTRSVPPATNSAGTSSAAISSTTQSAPASSGTSAATKGKSAHKGLGTGGIVGLVIGLLILLGLLVMFLMRRRAHRRYLQQKPRGSMLLPRDAPSDTPSFNSGSGGTASEMVESVHSPGVVGSAAGAIAAANLAAMPRFGYPAPQPYKPFNTEADGAIASSSTSAAVPVAQSKTNDLGHQTTDRHIPSTSQPSLLLSPHESPPSTSSFDATATTAAASSGTDGRRSRELPNQQSSATHADMIAFQKELERDHEKEGPPGGDRNADVNDPPPMYSN